ncbi:MAG: TIGR03790 family protein [Candidatus Omnitrophica bacterium]|nr:TIGR03790 family protein [Candidatus Omnitrophota bacterium]
MCPRSKKQQHKAAGFKYKTLAQKLAIFLCLTFLPAMFFPQKSHAEIRRIVITPMQQSGPIYSCQQYTMRFLNENGVMVPPETALTFNITSSSGQLQLFSNFGTAGNSCTGAITNGSFTVPAGHFYHHIVVNSPLPVYAKIYLTGVNTPFSYSESLVIQYTYTEPTELIFLTPAATLRQGLCTKFDFRYVDASGGAVALISPHTATFTVHPETEGILFSDSTCTQPLNEYVTPAGNSGGSIYTRLPEGFIGKVLITDENKAAKLSLEAQTINYDDVGIVVNINSPESIQIAQYFIQNRNIPTQNVFYVNAPTTEIINEVQFSAIRSQLAAVLPAHNDPNHVLNYLVTTKGLPLAIERDNHINSLSTSASFESEIALLAGPHANRIGLLSWVNVAYPYYPYYNRNEVFSRANYGFFLVTRLDAYTVQGVLDLIDRSHPLTTVYPSKSNVVFDQSPYWGWENGGLNAVLASAAAIMSAHGYPVELNTDAIYVTNRDDVLVYTSWGSNDQYPGAPGPALPMFNWLSGSIAETFVSESARSFTPGTTYGQSLIADLVLEGVSGVKGYVFEPMSSAMAKMQIVTDRYTRGFNFAESFGMGSASPLSWMDVLIGDPKMSIIPAENSGKRPIK